VTQVEGPQRDAAVLKAVRHVLHTRAEQLAEEDDVSPPARHLFQQRPHRLGEHLPEPRPAVPGVEFLAALVVRTGHPLPGRIPRADQPQPAIHAVDLFREEDRLAGREGVREVAEVLHVRVAVEGGVRRQGVAVGAFRRRLPLGHAEQFADVRPDWPVEHVRIVHDQAVRGHPSELGHTHTPAGDVPLIVLHGREVLRDSQPIR
jgi:hypothetical protein